MENLINCSRCESNACLEQVLEDNIRGYLCFGCGFTTSTALLKDSELDKHIFESSPELYKDLRYVDTENRVWYPAGITLDNIGMAFLDGTSVENYKWTGVLMTPILEEERSKFPENTTHKIDFTTSRHYSKNDFMEALDYIGFFKQQMMYEGL
jgi:hypothetical protein